MSETPQQSSVQTLLETLARKAMKPKQRARIALENDSTGHPLLPPVNQRLAALKLTVFPRVIVIGQDPYPQPNKSTGVAFEVAENFEPRRSDTLTTLCTQMDREKDNRSLSDLMAQGVMPLNETLTVRAKIKPRQKKHNGDTQAWAEWACKFCNYIHKEASEANQPSPIIILLGEDKWEYWQKKYRAPESLILRGYPGQDQRDYTCKQPQHDKTSTYANPFLECNKRLEVSGVETIKWNDA